jgi:hypothetical protein
MELLNGEVKSTSKVTNEDKNRCKLETKVGFNRCACHTLDLVLKDYIVDQKVTQLINENL